MADLPALAIGAVGSSVAVVASVDALGTHLHMLLNLAEAERALEQLVTAVLLARGASHDGDWLDRRPAPLPA